MPIEGSRGSWGALAATWLTPALGAAAATACAGVVADTVLAQLAGTDNAPMEPACPTPAETTGAFSCGVLSPPMPGLTAEASAGPIAGPPLPASNGLAPVMNWLMSMFMGSIANSAGVESISSRDIVVFNEENSGDCVSDDTSCGSDAADYAGMVEPGRSAGGWVNGVAWASTAAVLVS
jgi:hypothetical protein